MSNNEEAPLEEVKKTEPTAHPLRDVAFYVVVAVFAVYLYVDTIGYPPDSALSPRLAIYFTLALCILGLVDIFIRQLDRPIEHVATIIRSVSIEAPSRNLYGQQRYVVYLLVLFGFVLSVQTIGYFTSAFLLVVANFIYNDRSVVKGTITGIVLTSGLFFLFVEILDSNILLYEDPFVSYVVFNLL